MGQCLITRKGTNNNNLHYTSMDEYAYNGVASTVLDTGNTSSKEVAYFIKVILAAGTGSTKVQGSNDNSSWTDLKSVTSTGTSASGILTSSYRYFRIYGDSYYSGSCNSGFIAIEY